MSPALDPAELRGRLGEARLMLVFTPGLARGADPLQVLDAVLEHVDVVQVRPKALAGAGPCAARETYELALAVLDLVAGRAGARPLVVVDDRVDVAAALASRGVAGVHLGQDDLEPGAARALLGDAPLIGLSTHDAAQVAASELQPVDYLGFGPVFATSTKGYARGLGAERAWVADQASSRPLFPIGGIDATSAGELALVGRAAVGAAILSAEDPAAAARALRALLERERPG